MFIHTVTVAYFYQTKPFVNQAPQSHNKEIHCVASIVRYSIYLHNK